MLRKMWRERCFCGTLASRYDLTTPRGPEGGEGDEGAVEGLGRRRRGAHGEGPGRRGRDAERQRRHDEPARVPEVHLDDV